MRNYGLALQRARGASGVSRRTRDRRRWASAELRGDREVVYLAVKQCGLALAFASTELKRDRKLVLTAGRENVHALKHAAPELLADSAFMNRGYREHERKLRWLEAQLVRREHAARTYRKITHLNRMA